MFEMIRMMLVAAVVSTVVVVFFGMRQAAEMPAGLDDELRQRVQLNQVGETTQSLLARVQYLEDVNAIQRLQARYVHALFTQRFDSIPALYAMHPDVSVEFSDSSVFRGHDSVTRLYQAFNRIREIPGFFILHTAVDPYIELAADGLSARSHWLSPGASNSPGGSSWIWGSYYIDYIREDGEWRILHSNLVPLFRNPYEYSWNDAPNHGTVNVVGQLGLQPDEPTTLYRPFNEVKQEADMFRNHPELPAPYPTLTP